MFPEYRDLITRLKAENKTFARLFDEHNELDQRVKNIAHRPGHRQRGRDPEEGEATAQGPALRHAQGSARHLILGAPLRRGASAPHPEYRRRRAIDRRAQ